MLTSLNMLFGYNLHLAGYNSVLLLIHCCDSSLPVFLHSPTTLPLSQTSIYSRHNRLNLKINFTCDII